MPIESKQWEILAAMSMGALVAYCVLRSQSQHKVESPTTNVEKDLPDLDVHEHCNRKIAAERIGRINAEKTLRSKVVERISDPSIGYPLLVIGHVKSPYLKRRGTPRQGLLVPDSRTILTLANEIPTETLEGLEGYSHLFVQFLFHENTNLVKTVLTPNAVRDNEKEEIDEQEDSKALKSRTFASKSSTFTNRVHSFAAKVLPPLLSGGSIGLFATRSPHRPNALGLSLVKIISVDPQNRTVVVAGADLVNGTPIVDLKPWGPFDCPTCIHNVVDHDGVVSCHPTHDRCDQFVARVPGWVAYGLQSPYVIPVEWSLKSIETVTQHIDAGDSEFYRKGESKQLIDAISEILSLDIRSVHRGRGQSPKMLQRNPSLASVNSKDTMKTATERQKPVPESPRATDLIGDRIRDINGAKQSYELQYDIFDVSFTIRTGGHEKYASTPWILIDSVKNLKEVV
ncbi:TsaA-like domain-containing protein [Globomyces pollinis-pini]|nr:TsaA-like domain-containing protein [Globomyces pollinis-pini]